MKKIFFIAAIAATVLAACSKDKTVATRETGKAVEFRTVTDKGTRTAVTDGTNILSFTVTGWWDQDGSQTYGDLTTGAFLFDAKDINRGEVGAANEWEYTPKRYWPTAGTVDFFAYSPASSRNLGTGLKGLDATAPEIVYTVPAVAETNAQEDFLVAAAPGLSSGVVALNFQHALSRVKFEAKKDVADVEYLIDGIELVNLYSNAELDITAAGAIPSTGGFTYGGATPVVLWKNHATLADYAADFSDSPVYVKEDYTSVIGVTNALMVMPQPTALGAVYTKADYTAGTVTFDQIMAPKTGEEGKFYIKVSYKAYQDDFYYAGSATTSKEMYLPVKDPAVATSGVTFEMGRQYTFRITFGNGGNDDLGDVIDFTVNVQAWDVTAAPIVL